MLAIELDPCQDGAMQNYELLKVHHSKISLHHAKNDYSYPTIRLPYKFSQLAGLSTRIYQTVHEGALAFLVVVSSSDTASESSPDKPENALSSAKYFKQIDVRPSLQITSCNYQHN
jgi:hypothetical protein